MDTNEMIALLLPPNGCFACSDTRKEIAEELARRSVDLERECADADKICAALGLTVDKSRTEGGSLNVPRIVGHIQETLTALRESHAFGVAMSDKYVASRAPECAAAQKPVAWATPSLLVTLSAVEKNHLTNPDRRTRGGEFESAAADAERYSVPLYAAPPAQAEPQEGDLLHTMMEWARTEEGRKQLADSYRPHLWACAKRVADPQNEAATCRHWCGNIEHCQPIASAPAQAEPQPDFSTAANAAQQEQHDDNESDGGRTRRMAGEGNADQLRHDGREGAVGRSGAAEHDAGFLRPQQHADSGRGNAPRFLIDNDTLRKQIAADPDDEPSAGSPAATDDAALVERLRDAGAGEESGSHTHRAIFDAIDRIAELTAERDEQHRMAVKRWDDMCAYADRTIAAESALAAANERAEGMRVALDVYQRATAYFQDRLRSLGYEGWARDYDGEIAALAAKGAPDA